MIIIDIYGRTSKDMEDTSLKAMQEVVGGYIEIVSVPENTDYILIVNEDGISKGLTVNAAATKIAGQRILGDVIYAKREELGEDEDESSD